MCSLHVERLLCCRLLILGALILVCRAGAVTPVTIIEAGPRGVHSYPSAAVNYHVAFLRQLSQAPQRPELNLHAREAFRPRLMRR